MAQARPAASSPAPIWAPSQSCRFCGMYSRNSRRLAEDCCKSLDPAAYPRSAAPVGDGPVHVGQFLGKRLAGSGSTRQWYIRGKPS